MRTANSIKNIISSFLIMGIGVIFSFITRKLFIDTIGIQYLGLNGLLSNILAAVTLIESGFGASVIYNLYQPIAKGDKQTVIALIQLYKKVYAFIAITICIICISIVPFLKHFINDPEPIPYLYIVYTFFVINSLIPYFSAHKLALLNTHQQNHKLLRINIIHQISLPVSRIIILYYSKNYILYLSIESLFAIALNIFTVKLINRLFPYSMTKEKFKVPSDIVYNIKNNVKALILSALGSYFMHSTSNLLISKYISLAVVGIYSNYTLITDFVSRICSQLFNSVSDSAGNLIASSTPERSHEVFRELFLLNFVISFTLANILYTTLNDFICIWLGNEYIFSKETVLLIILYFLLPNLRTSAMTFKIKGGIFQQDKFTPLLQGIINLILSLILLHYLEINGILLALIISFISIGFWQTPRLVYKHIFKINLSEYFQIYFLYLFIGIISHLISIPFISFSISTSPIIQIIYKLFVSAIIPFLTYFLILRNSSEFKSLVQRAKTLAPFLR